MTSIAAAGDFDPEELARRVASLSEGELREFLVLVDYQRNSMAGLSGEGTLSVGPPKQADILTRVTKTITTSWRVEAPEPAPTSQVPHGSASGTTTWTGTAIGEAPPIKSPAVAALWDYVKKVSPQDNTQCLATLEAVIKTVLIVWLVTGPPAVSSEILNSVQRALEGVVSAVQEQVEGGPAGNAATQ